jgi:hypothetical protein
MTDPKWLEEIRERAEKSQVFTFPAAIDRAALLSVIDKYREALKQINEGWATNPGSKSIAEEALSFQPEGV